MDESYPVFVEKQGIKIKEESMETEKLYYCIYNERIYLFFKDIQDNLNCYEIEEKDVVDQIKNIGSKKEIEKLLEDFAKQKNSDGVENH